MKRLQNEWKKGVSVAMAVLLVGGSIRIPAHAEEPESWIRKNALSVVESLEPEVKTAVAELSDQDRGQLAKEETVYVIANADGSPEKLIVSDWLKNAMGSETLEDSTELTNIINVKGTESFEQKEGSLGVWDAAGNDIYYQGSIEKELPVDLKVTYQLNGRTVSPDELAGQSGKVKIRFDYTNRQKEKVAVGEKEEELYVPFAVITSLVLDNENFRNIEVSNGKVINDGERTIIMGYAMPGLKDNLDIGSEDFDVEELDIPDYVELTADVTDFELAATLTVATNEIFGDIDIETQEKMDDLSADMDELQDAMNELMDGTAELYDGVLELYDGTGELTDGIDELNDGAKELDDGAKELDDGAKDLNDGAKKLDDGAGELHDGAGELYNGIGTLKSGAGALFAGVKQLADGLGQITRNDAKLNQGAKAVYEGLLQLANAQLAGFSAYGVTTLDPSGKTPEQFCAEIEAGVRKLNVLSDTLKASMPGLTSRMAPEELPADEAVEEEQKEEVSTVSEEPAEKEEQPAGTDTEAVKSQEQQPQDMEKVPAESESIPEETKDQKQEVQGSEAQEQEVQGSEAQEQEVQEQEVQEVQEPASQENSQAPAEAVSEEESREAEPQAEVSEKQTVLVQSSQAGNAQAAAAIAELKQKLQLIEMTKSTLQLLEGAYQVYMGVGSYTQGVDQIYAGVQELMKNAPTLNSGIDALSDGAGKLRDGAGELKNGTSELKNGTSELKNGTGELRDGTRELRDGTGELKDGGQELRDGVEELRDGSEELRDGTIEFNDEGIQKLTDKFNGDLRELSDRFEGVKSAARAYQSFSGISDKAEGNVRFIYKTAGIEK